MSSISARLKKHHGDPATRQAQLLTTRLRQEGCLETEQNIMQAVNKLATLLSSNHNASYNDSVMELSQHLKVHGCYLDRLYKEQMDHAFCVFRDRAQNESATSKLTRIYLLELIELRANGWKNTDTMDQYYRKRILQEQQTNDDILQSLKQGTASLSNSCHSDSDGLPIANGATSTIDVLQQLSPGEVLRASGKYPRPTRIPGKKYCKDEVIIRNADSGKVMGIKGRRVHMIEELSETIISFQRVAPGAKERLVQITGANEESINHAKQLMEDTIKRNASPTRNGLTGSQAVLFSGSMSSVNSSTSEDSALPTTGLSRTVLQHSLSTNDANFNEYKYTVMVDGYVIKISTTNYELGQKSKLALEDYFSVQYGKERTIPKEVLEKTSFSSFVAPLSPPESLPSPEASPIRTNGNGAIDDLGHGVIKRRSSHEFTVDKDYSVHSLMQIRERQTRNGSKHHLVYSIESLTQLAMSPLCLARPNDWDYILQNHPNLVRHSSDAVNAKEYLSNRYTANVQGTICNT